MVDEVDDLSFSFATRVCVCVSRRESSNKKPGRPVAEAPENRSKLVLPVYAHEGTPTPRPILNLYIIKLFDVDVEKREQCFFWQTETVLVGLQKSSSPKALAQPSLEDVFTQPLRPYSSLLRHIAADAGAHPPVPNHCQYLCARVEASGPRWSANFKCKYTTVHISFRPVATWEFQWAHRPPSGSAIASIPSRNTRCRLAR